MQLSGSWELDLFGKNRSALDVALGAANAAAAHVDAAGVLLASHVARSDVQWARLDDQRTVAERTLAQRQATLRLVRDRVAAGLDTRRELRPERWAARGAAAVEALDEQIALTRHALDALTLSTVRAIAMGTLIATTLWQNRAALHHAPLAESVHAGNAATQSAIAGFASSGLSPTQGLAQINRLNDQQASCSL